MKSKAKKNKIATDEIAEKAMNGEDISSFFTNKGEMKSPTQRVNEISKKAMAFQRQIKSK